MHPTEFFWQAEAYEERAKRKDQNPGAVSEDEAEDMLDELRRIRREKGLPPE